jgi:hypothetical protein
MDNNGIKTWFQTIKTNKKGKTHGKHGTKNLA